MWVSLQKISFDVFLKVSEVRKRTRDEKKQMAMAMRQKQLESLGMMVRYFCNL